MPLGGDPGRGRWPRAALILGLLGLVLAAKLPNTSKLLAVLNDAAHAPVFGLVALLMADLLEQLPRRRRLAFAFLLTIGLGLVVEVIQGMSGRDASWLDVRTDALGALCALSVYAWRQGPPVERASSMRVAPIVGLIAGIAILHPVAEAGSAYVWRAAAFPRLLDFDRPLALYFLEVQGAHAEREPLPRPWRAESDPTSLKVTVQQGDHPGINLTEPFPEWVGYEELRIDVTNPGERPLPLTLRVHDRMHDHRLLDRFNRTFELRPAARTVLSVPLRDIAAAPHARALDLGSVAGVILFTSGQGAQAGRIFYVTGVWLE